MFKRCNVCGELLPLEDLYRSAGVRDGHRNAERPNACRREHNATPERKRALRDGYDRRQLGNSADDVDALIAAQGDVCASCGQASTRLASWQVDHDHDTGEVPGVLCIDCHQGIGKLHESVERLRGAADYLERTSR